MTYSEHFRFSINLSKIYFVASFKALVHSFIPNLFITSSTDTQNKIDFLLKNSGCNKKN